MSFGPLLQRQQVLNDTSSEGAKVVAPLKNTDDFPLAVPICDRDEPTGHLPKTILAQFNLRQRILAMGIEAGGDQKKLRREFIQSRHDGAVEGRKILGISRVRIERNVKRKPLAPSRPLLPREARAGIARARMLVKADKQNAVVLLEDRLRPVAVVNVEIDDRDAPDPVCALKVSGRDGDVIEETKPHRPIRLGVMPRRPHRGKCSIGTAAYHCIAATQRRPDSHPGDLEALRPHDGVPQIERSAADFADVFHALNVRSGMHCRQPPFVRHCRLGQFEHFRGSLRKGTQVNRKFRKWIGRVDKTRPADRSRDRAQPVGPLRVMRSGQMVHEARRCAKCDIHFSTVHQTIASNLKIPLP